MEFAIFLAVLIFLVIIGAIAGTIGAVSGTAAVIANEIREDKEE